MTTYNIFSGDITYQKTDGSIALPFTGDDVIYLAEGAKISTSNVVTGAIAGSLSGIAKMTLNGTVANYLGPAITTGTDRQEIEIGATGIVFADKTAISVDILGNGTEGSDIDNLGAILSMTGTGITASKSNNYIYNSGTITGNNGIQLGQTTADVNNNVFNSGSVIGRNFGIFVHGNDAHLTNMGTVTAGGSAALGAVLFSGAAFGTATLVNSGTIFSSTRAVFSQGDLNDVITNSGQIFGSIELGNGNDVVANSGEIYSSIDLGSGNDLIDSLAGVNWGNILLGDGEDTLYGGGGAETADGGNGDDLMHGHAGLDSFEGGSGNDTLEGGADNDLLNGGIGDDQLNGGIGDDHLHGGDGIDTAVFSGAVGAFVDLNLQNQQQNTGYNQDTLTGIENLAGGTGNDRFIGDLNANSLVGNAGNDWLDGGAGDDVLDGGAGIDTVAFSGSMGATVDLNLQDQKQDTQYGQDTLTSIENLTGGTGADKFTGDGKANVFDGGLGNDTLDGGAGIDTVAFTGAAGAKADLTKTGVQSTGYGVDILLRIENLTGGTGADRFTGSTLANILAGNAGKDTLNGGAGNDKLTGGTQADAFAFTTKLNKSKNVDTVTDFKRVDDSFQLDNAIFKKLGSGSAASPKLMSKSFFASGTKAKDENDYIIYNKTKGYLYYDADGSGKGAAVLFAKITKGLSIDYRDFYVI